MRKKISAERPSKNVGTWILGRLRYKILSTATFLMERKRALKQILFSLPALAFRNRLESNKRKGILAA